MQPIRLDDASLPEYLRERGLLEAAADAEVESAGDGNINWVRRVRCGPRSWIVKQARPALERFPEYEASTERIVFEARYFECAAPVDAEGVCPTVLCFDEANRVLVLEDLGAAERLDHCLARAGDCGDAPRRLGAFLGAVHAATRDPSLAGRFENGEMRRLHGDHVFDLPFRENDFPLEAPVRARAESIWKDGRLAAAAAAAYERYLAPRGALVHGDVQAGNVLLAPGGAKLLDAEIAHVGDPAFDVGTLAAHLLLPAVARGEPRAARPALRAAWTAYRGSAGGGSVEAADAVRYAALEMTRRTIGAARVAVVEPPSASLRVLDFAEPLALGPDPSALDG